MLKGYFGDFGGQFVPELLIPPLQELEAAMERFLSDTDFKRELNHLFANYVGRPTPLYYCPNLSKDLGFKLWLKREDLTHTGAHKINNTLGQALLTKYMGKSKIIAETGAGQHGVATATAAAMLGLECLVFMGALDVQRQALNVKRMELLGAKVVPVESGTKTLKDAINAALRYWISHQEDTHYCIGSVVGPHPFPYMVREFQAVIGKEAKEQIIEQSGRLPDKVVACVGGGSNAMGIFFPFFEDKEVELIGVEAGGSGKPGDYHSATLNKGLPGVLHGTKTNLLQTKDGQILPSHSIAPGLDYPGVGPEHTYFQSIGRAKYEVVYDKEALEAFYTLSAKEGIIPALESSHALAYVLKLKGKLSNQTQVIVNLSGRGDKDLDIVFGQEFLR
ncbi:MAG: tryptophan synthase beta chain [Desulfonauticus sp.]|jgi:tryptophan synthase beta chain|nr:tryptophan synthase beta chain [Desulfonauticus sp.]